MEWSEVIAQPDFQDLNSTEQTLVRQRWVQEVYTPKLQALEIPETDIEGLQTEAMEKFDNGQGYVSSLAGSAMRGLLGTAASAVRGAGAITQDPDLEAGGEELQQSIEGNFNVNPSLTKTNFVGNVAGNVASFVASAGAGGLIGKGLGAASLGAEIGGLGTGFLAGAGGGAEEADQYGITGDARLLRALGGGLTEVLSEKIPLLGGLGSELKAVSKIPGLGKLAAPAAGGVVKAVGSEIVEENVANTTGNALTSALAPAGVETPGLLSGALEATAGGALGGAAFGGIGLIGGRPASEAEDAANNAANNAEALLEATGDTAAAEVIRQANATRPAPMVSVPLPVVPEARAGDSSVNELLVPPQDMDLAAYAAQGTPKIEEEDAPFDTSGVPFVLPPEIPAAVNPGEVANPVQTMPPVAEPVLPVGVPSPVQTPATGGIGIGAPPAAPAARTFTPQEVRQMAADDGLIDVTGRIDAAKATSIFGALKDLGVTKARLVINATGVAPDTDGIQRARGQRTMFQGEDTVFINENEVTLDTPLHEVFHGLVPEMRTNNKALYDQGVAIVANSPLAAAIRRRYEAAGIPMDNDQFMEEVLTTAVANNGADLFEAYAGNGAVVRQIKEWLAQIRVWVEEFMGSKGVDPNMSIGEFSAKVNRRILAGKMKEGAGAAGFSAPAAVQTKSKRMARRLGDVKLAPAVQSPVAKQEKMVDWLKAILNCLGKT